MKITIIREELLKVLQLVSGAVERRQTLPILSNVLLIANENVFSVTATDLEVELVGTTQNVNVQETGKITVPARKLIDICRTLPESSEIELNTDKEKVIIKAVQSRFTLSTLPAQDFPAVEDGVTQLEVTLNQADLKRILQETHFAIAQQDVRYYLNGILLDFRNGELKAVATDGHRLALSGLKEVNIPAPLQIIIPRKGVLELMRLISDLNEVQLKLGHNHIRATTTDFTFTSKLIEGKFPDYQHVIPKNSNKFVQIDRDIFKQALIRAAILCNEKYHGIRFCLSPGKIQIIANNFEQEQAEESILVDYTGEELEIGFNVNYLLDALSVLPIGMVKLSLADSNSSVLLEHTELTHNLYVIMPMRL